jgi:hypothetical protein
MPFSDYFVDQNAINNGPWATRAWTLQEQFLATRILYFTERFFYMECLDTIEVEPGMPADTEGRIKRSARPWATESDPESNGMESTEERLHKLYNSWRYTVQRYTTRDISFASDRSQAIAGLAARMLRELGDRDEYMYGLFTGDIVNGLLWEPRQSDEKISRQVDDQIPSWSWLSHPRNVSYSQSFQSLIPMVTHMPEPMGSPVPKLLRMSGLVVSAADILSSSQGGAFQQGLIDQGIYATPSTEFEADYTVSEQDVIGLTAVAIARYEDDGDKDPLPILYGLLLQRLDHTSNAGLPIYRRFGTFEIEGDWKGTIFNDESKRQTFMLA